MELVLDYIVERKRMDDLADSITDGRFREQKVVPHSLSVKHNNSNKNDLTICHIINYSNVLYTI